MPSRNRKPVRLEFVGAVLCVWFAWLAAGTRLSCAQESGAERQTLPAPTWNGSVEMLKRMGNAFASVTERVSPGVVGIQAQRTVVSAVPPRPTPPSLDPFGEDVFEYFFRRRTPPQEAPPREQVQRAQGSGFIISNEGYVLTNNHVIAEADKVVVELVDGRALDAQIVGTDPESDVAVIRIAADRLTPVALGDSDALEVGEWVLAIGNPLGLSHTVTAGIVSAKGRRGFNVTTYENFIQTDAAVNMGNSGGPLVNLNGQAVGMNTFILGPAGGNIGIGFAIPIDSVREVADQLIKNGGVERGYLGLIPQDLTPELAEAFGVQGTKGAIISQVTEGSAAAEAGVRHGDIVPRFDGVAIDSASQFRNLVASRKPGQTVPMVVLRDGERRTLDVTLIRRPSVEELSGRRRELPKPSAQKPPRPLGLTVQDLTPEAMERSELKEAKGVIITKIAPGSEAAEKGLREGYVIQEINRRPIENEPQFTEAVAQALSEKSHILLLITNGRVSQYLVLHPSTP